MPSFLGKTEDTALEYRPTKIKVTIVRQFQSAASPRGQHEQAQALLRNYQSACYRCEELKKEAIAIEVNQNILNTAKHLVESNVNAFRRQMEYLEAHIETTSHKMHNSLSNENVNSVRRQ